MRAEECVFSLAPVYAKIGANYVDGRALEIDCEARRVAVEKASGECVEIAYDYLLNATGPYLNFEATPGLGPARGNTASVCSVEHALDARDKYLEIVRGLEKGERKRLVIGVGHPTSTCEGAAFEYIMNVDHDLRRRGLRERAELVWLTNEPDLADFGVDGIEAKKHGALVTGAALLRMLMDESRIRTMLAVGVTGVADGKIAYDQVGEEPGELAYDFAMLIPQFRGIPLKYVGREGADITEQMTLPNAFMRVDADYAPKSYEQYRAGDWPALYRSPLYDTVYAAGIAFAPPHPMSRAKKTARGLTVIASAPRTGMASGIMGRTVAENIADQVEGHEPSHRAPMSEMPAACIGSMGTSLVNGSAASIIMDPVARDYETYPDHGRDLWLCELDVGLGGAWTKRLLHSAFLWQLQAKPGWQMIPE
jgi:sulfide:quinone oxidoreductase